MAKKRKSKKKNVKKDFVKDEVKELRKQVQMLRRRASPMIAEGQHRLEEGREFAMKEEKELEQYIKKNPMKSVGVAFAVGFLMGKMSR